MNRNLVAAVVLVALVLAGCGGGGDSPADSESETGPAIVGGSDASSRDDDGGVVGSPDAEDSPAIVSGSEDNAPVDADADGGSRADEDAGLGDRWPWCWNWGAVQSQSERVSAELVVLLEKRDAFNATERPDASSFEKARAEAAYQEAQDAYDAVESALERLKAGLDDALAQAQAAALANGDEAAYSAADIVLAMREDQERFSRFLINPVIGEKLAEAPRTVFSSQFRTAMSQFLIAQSWYGARQDNPFNRAVAAIQAADAAADVGYVDAPIWAAWAVAADAAADAAEFFIVASDYEVSDYSTSKTYWVDEAANAAEWAAAAADAVTVYYTAQDAETKQSAMEWATSIATADSPSPPAPPQAVTEAMRILAEREAAATRRSIGPGAPAPAAPEAAVVGPDEPAPAEPDDYEPPPVPIGGTPISVPTPHPRERAVETVSDLYEAADRSSKRAYGTINENLTFVIVTELCRS